MPVAEGRSNKAITAELVITTRTVESHVKEIFQELGLTEDPSITAGCSRCSPSYARRGSAGVVGRRSRVRVKAAARTASPDTIAVDEQRLQFRWPSYLLLCAEAVAQTPGEAAGSLLRVGSEIGHLVRRERVVRRKVVPHGGSVVHFRERAARFLRRLCATASVRCERLVSVRPDARSPRANERRLDSSL
jgi:hypothetical protein